MKKPLVQKITKTIGIIILAVAVNAKAGLQITNEYWVSARTDNPTNALGTLDDPYDGSTASKFDTLMGNFPVNSTIHILAGTYQTTGSSSWHAKSGQKILGSGIDVTKLQLASASYSTNTYVSVIESLFGSNIEVSDMTLDCNYTTGNYNFNGVGLIGDHHAIRRVKVINAVWNNTAASESFPISIANAGWGGNTNSEGNIIEECEVSSFKGGYISGISMNGNNLGTNWISGVMRNNTIILPQPPNGSQQMAINGSWLINSVVEGNYVNGAEMGFYGDTGACTNVIVANNTFKNCSYGAFFQPAVSGVVRKNFSFVNNNIDINTNGGAAFDFRSGVVYENIAISGNNIQYNEGRSGSGGYAIIADSVRGVTMNDNRIEGTFLSSVQNCTNLNIFNNFDLFGNPLNGLNQQKLVPFTVSYYNIDGKVTGTYSLLTVPTNLAFITTSVAVETSEKTGAFSSGVQSSLGSATSTASIVPVTGTGTTPSSGTYQLRNTVTDAHVLTNGETLTFRVSTAAVGGTKWTVNAHVTGFFR